MTSKKQHRITDCGIFDADSYCECNGKCIEMGYPPRPEIESAKKWIKQWFDARKTINDRHSSYALKHIMERHTDTYVSNGSFIRAAIELGFEYRRCTRHSVNVCFNASYKRLNNLIDELS